MNAEGVKVTASRRVCSNCSRHLYATVSYIAEATRSECARLSLVTRQ